VPRVEHEAWARWWHGRSQLWIALGQAQRRLNQQLGQQAQCTKHDPHRAPIPPVGSEQPWN